MPTLRFFRASPLVITLTLSAMSVLAADKPPDVPSPARPAPHDPGVFRPDPKYPEDTYRPREQIFIYGGKHPNPTARPLLELGRELYTEGPFNRSPDLFGKKNLIFGHLLLYGDWRTAVGVNSNGAARQSTIATRLNLDVDVKLTATERIHVLFRPLEKKGDIIRYDFAGDAHGANGKFNAEPDAVFFEGELNRIVAGITNTDPRWDLPFTAGLMPMLFQNGVWVEDAFWGGAFTIPARNSRILDISNADITFFAGFDKATSAAVRNPAGQLADHTTNVYGVNAFIEANLGYWEIGYGYTDPRSPLADQSYHNFAAAFTRRYANKISNSVRVIWNTGQHRDPGKKQTADGVLLLVENSLITSQPSTVVPYLNAFIGFDRPQSLLRDAGAGGVLKNTGINFETDGMTGFPKLDDTAQNTYGGALGLQYLFDLDQQIVFELAFVGRHNTDTVAKGNQYAAGWRYQIPLSNSWIFRADAIYGHREKDKDIAGVRIELRRKF